MFALCVFRNTTNENISAYKIHLVDKIETVVDEEDKVRR
jgi:hypothetical protein